jgi:hypothetical protein
MRFVKGLFWESARANTWLNSYFATLLSPPVVLDYFYFFNYPCDIQRCLMDHFVALAGVTSWIVPEDFALPYLNPAQSSCFRQIVSSGGTSRLKLERTGSMRYGEKSLTQFRLRTKTPADLGNSWIERVSPTQLEALPQTIRPQETALRRIHESCLKGTTSDTAWLDPQDLQSARAHASGETKSAATYSIQKIAPGKYALEVPGPPGHFRIKLAPLPGAKLRDANGRELPLWGGYPHLIGYGAGKMELEFVDLPEMRWGNWISLISAILVALLAALIQRKPKTNE